MIAYRNKMRIAVFFQKFPVFIHSDTTADKNDQPQNKQTENDDNNDFECFFDFHRYHLNSDLL